MRLSMILWIIKTEVCVICRIRRLRQIIQTRGFDNSWYHAKTEFNDCFIIHFLNNRQKKTFRHWHDKCNICSRYCIYHVKFISCCELIECSRPIRFFKVSLMYNKSNYNAMFTKLGSNTFSMKTMNLPWFCSMVPTTRRISQNNLKKWHRKN